MIAGLFRWTCFSFQTLTAQKGDDPAVDTPENPEIGGAPASSPRTLVTLPRVARLTESLVVRALVGSSATPWHDVVQVVARLALGPASPAVGLLAEHPRAHGLVGGVVTSRAGGTSGLLDAAPAGRASALEYELAAPARAGAHRGVRGHGFLSRWVWGPANLRRFLDLLPWASVAYDLTARACWLVPPSARLGCSRSTSAGSQEPLATGQPDTL